MVTAIEECERPLAPLPRSTACINVTDQRAQPQPARRSTLIPPAPPPAAQTCTWLNALIVMNHLFSETVGVFVHRKPFQCDAMGGPDWSFSPPTHTSFGARLETLHHSPVEPYGTLSSLVQMLPSQ
jgi:hypothetical protein